jgi:hypothetical protein
MARRHALWIGLALLTSGCLGQADAKKADDATARFYQQLAAKQYQAIYDEAAPDLKTAASLDDFTALMQRVDQAMGACKAPVKRLDFHTNATPAGFFREQGYSRACANGPLTETVTIVVRNGQARLAGYRFAGPPPSSGPASSG